MKAAVEWLQLFVVGLGISVVVAGWLLGYQETVMKLYMIKCEVCESPIVICKCEIGGYLFIKSA